MEPMNPKQEQRVWSRVMGVQTACTRLAQRENQEGARDIPVLDAESLMELYTAQLRAACTYRTLANMARGCVRQTLMRLTEEKRGHARRIEAMYYIQTGQKPCPDQPKTPCVSCLNEALRQAYREEQCAAELYRRYAKNAGDFACVLEQLAQEACRHAQMLLGALQVSL